MHKLIVFLSFVLFAVPSFVSSAEPAAVFGQAEFAAVRHVVKKGEVLSQIAVDFKIPMRRILLRGFNPRLADRNNPDLIYAGEIIMIPLLVLTKEIANRPASSVPAGSGTWKDPVVLKLPEVAKAPAVAEASGPGAGMETAYLLMGLLAVLLVAAYVSWRYYLRPKESRTTSDEKKGSSLRWLFEEMTPEEIIQVFGNLRATALVEAMKLPIANDERGNKVLLCNIGSYMLSRKEVWPEDVLVKDLDRRRTTKGSPVPAKEGEPVTAGA